MAGAFGLSARSIYLGVAMVLLLGLATPASSLLLNSSNPLTCSSKCESENCKDPAELRYGKYCGVGYTGCSGQAACDGIDSCCERHDQCIGSNLANYLNTTCNGNLKSCITSAKNSNAPQFAGANCSASGIEAIIIAFMDIAIAAPGNPSSPINLHWAILFVLILSAVLLH